MDQEQNILAATLSDETLSLPNEYFLAIKTKQDPSELAKLVLDRDKFKTYAAESCKSAGFRCEACPRIVSTR